MGFASPALLGGIALIVIPIALHLVMRRQPQRIPFPALRFVKQRRDANRRRLQLRQLALLALRCLLVAGLALALARPTLPGSGLQGKQGAPLAVAIVIDNAPRMGYIRNDRTRLAEATEAALQWLAKLPPESEAALIERTRSSAGFAVDLATAEARVRNVRIAARPRPLAAAIVEAIELAASRNESRQEVFVFSDLAAQAWTPETIEAVDAALREAPETSIFVADVGVDQPRNAALGAVELSNASLRQGESLRLTAPVQIQGATESLVVELLLTDEKGKLFKRGEQIMEGVPDEPRNVAFDVADLPLGTHQGQIRISAADPLEFDNQRYFTVTVAPPAQILLWARRSEDALFVREALCPTLLSDAPQQFACTIATYDGPLPEWTEFDAVWLLDPPVLADERWQALASFAEAGGGVGIFLGSNVGDFTQFNSGPPQRLLPGPLLRRSREETYLSPQRLEHPALRGLRDYAAAIPWPVYRVYQFWELADLYDDTYVVVPYANGRPALIERGLGRGRVLTMTTPVSDPLQPEGREPWNVIPTGPEPWPFVALCDQLAGYLTQQGSEGLNYLAGETARVPLSTRDRVSSFILRQPDGQALRRAAPLGEREIPIGSTELAGNYRLTAGGGAEQFDRGFSVNFAPEQSDLSRVDANTLTSSWPADQVRVEDDAEALDEYVRVGRSGHELFSWAIAAVALLWAGEHLLANRFYREAT